MPIIFSHQNFNFLIFVFYFYVQTTIFYLKTFSSLWFKIKLFNIVNGYRYIADEQQKKKIIFINGKTKNQIL